MNFKLDSDFIKSAELLLENLHLHDYEFNSGISSQSNAHAIISKFPQLWDISQYKNLDEAKYADSDKNRIRLTKNLVADFILLNKCSALTDSIKNKAVKDLGSEDIYLLNAISAIKTLKNREKRIILGNKCRELVQSYIPLISNHIETQNQTSNELGFKNYSEQISALHNIDTDDLVKQCTQFLDDTEYIYRDLLRWQLKHKLDLRFENTKIEDLIFLFNSFELKDYFKQTSLLKYATTFLNELGLSLDRSIQVNLDNRKTKISQSGFYPVMIPSRILISLQRIKSIEDYENILSLLGKSLFYCSIHIDSNFEQKRLADPLYVEILSSIFGDFVFEPHWLKRYLRIEPDKNFTEFLYLKKLFNLRFQCINVLQFKAIYDEKDIGIPLAQISEYYQKYMLFTRNESLIVNDIVSRQSDPYSDCLSALYGSYAKKYLVNRLDIQWWREQESGIQITKWLTYISESLTEKFSEDVNVTKPDFSVLIKQFEQVF